MKEGLGHQAMTKLFMVEYSIPGMFTFLPMTMDIYAIDETQAKEMFFKEKNSSWEFENVHLAENYLSPYQKQGLGHQTDRDLRNANFVKSQVEHLSYELQLAGSVKVGSAIWNILDEAINKLADLAIREDDRLNENC